MCRLNVSFFFVLTTLLSLYVNDSSACDGYKFNIDFVETCGHNNVVLIDGNVTTTLDKNCMLSTVGCFRSMGYKEAKVKYSITKDGQVLLSGEPDICRVLDAKNEDQKAHLQMFGFPALCPLPMGEKCTDGSQRVDISKFKDLLPAAVGIVTARYEVKHDTGTTCVIVQFEIKK